MIRRPPTSTLFPYPPLFRSRTTENQLSCPANAGHPVISGVSSSAGTARLVFTGSSAFAEDDIDQEACSTSAPPHHRPEKEGRTTENQLSCSANAGHPVISGVSSSAGTARLVFTGSSAFAVYFNDPATSDIYALSLPAALPISDDRKSVVVPRECGASSNLKRFEFCGNRSACVYGILRLR